jgi:hypothetical protein
MLVSCTVFVLSGRGLYDVPIPRPEQSYRLRCVSECDQVKINNLDTCCEQVGRRGKDCEKKRNVRSWLQTFSHNLSVPSSTVKQSTKIAWPLKMEVRDCPETCVSNHNLPRITFQKSEDLNYTVA